MTEVDIHAPGVEVKKSCCYFCHQNCGVLAYVKDGRVIKIEGDPEHLTNQGGLCCRGNIALKHIDHPARINHALRRAGKKGENKWEQIPYDQAIKEIAERLNQIKEESGAEAVATAGGTLRTEDWARRRFMNLFGSPNGFHNALLCWIPTFMVETAVTGWSPFETDLGSSKCVIFWGFNPGASAMPGMRGYSDLKKQGLKIIVVDPRYSETASHADLWLPLRPGSDTALSLALLHTVIFEGLYNFEFVQNWTVGFDELKEAIRPYSAKWASEKTWLDAELIRTAARMYAMNTPGNIQWGCTADQLGKSAGLGMFARACLRAICGNLDCPGGDLIPGPSMAYVTDEELEANDWLPEEQKAKQIGSDKFKLTSWPGYQMISNIAKRTWGKAPTAEWMCEAHGPSVFKAILTGDPYKIRALIVNATNPVNSYGDAKMTLEALKQVEFLVTCEYWMTPAALYSDYVLPVAGALERPTIHNNYGVTDSLLASQRAIQPMYDRHDDYSFWRSLGLACGQDEDMWPWECTEEVFYYVIYPLGLPVSSYDEFVEQYRLFFPPQRFYKYGQNGFCTASGKVELKSSVLEKLGYPAVPTYVGPSENEEDDPEVAAEYPLVLTTGGGFMPFHHSEQFNIESVRYLYHAPRFTINPHTAAELHIKDGDWCWIETRRGRIKQRANVEPSVDPRVIYAQRGWWYPEREASAEEPFGCLESNVNVLTSVDDEHCCPIGGSWANRGLLCKVYKCSSNGNEKVDTTWSIPGSSKTPGITVLPSQQKLAYDPIPYESVPPFEMPEGLYWDPDTEFAWDLDRGYYYDPETGWLIDPETNAFHMLGNGYRYDEAAEDLVDDATGIHYDMETLEPKGAAVAAAAGAAKKKYRTIEDLHFDDYSQKYWDVEKRAYYDVETGWLIGMDDDNYYNLETGWRYDPDTEDFVDDETGFHYDVETFEPKGEAAKIAAAAAAASAATKAPKYRTIGDLHFDDYSQKFWDVEKRAYYDDETGWLIGMDDDNYYNLETGYRYDPDAEDLVDDATGIHYDMETFEPKGGAAVAAAAVEVAAPKVAAPEVAAPEVAAPVAAEPEIAEPVAPKFRALADLQFDDRTQKFWDADKNAYLDEETGWLVGKDDGALYNLETGYRYDADAKDLVDDETGIHYTFESLRPKVGASVVEPVAKNLRNRTVQDLHFDDYSQKFWDPDNRAYYDDESGWLIGIYDDEQYHLETGLRYDAEAEDLIDDDTGIHYDLETLEAKGEAVIPDAPKFIEAVAEEVEAEAPKLRTIKDLKFDDRSQKFWDVEKDAYYDVETGWLIGADDARYQLETGYRYDAEAEDLVDDATGIHFDMASLAPKAAAAAAVAKNLRKRTIQDLHFDDFSQKFWDPDNRAYYDDQSGWLVGIYDDELYQLETGLRYDAAAEDLVDDDTGIHYDMETLEAKVAAVAAAAEAVAEVVKEGIWTEASEPAKFFVAENYNFDSKTDYDWQVTKDNYFDRVAFQIETGYVYDKETNTLLDEQTGLRFDAKTFEPIEGGE